MLTNSESPWREGETRYRNRRRDFPYLKKQCRWISFSYFLLCVHVSTDNASSPLLTDKGFSLEFSTFVLMLWLWSFWKNFWGMLEITGALPGYINVIGTNYFCGLVPHLVSPFGIYLIAALFDLPILASCLVFSLHKNDGISKVGARAMSITSFFGWIGDGRSFRGYLFDIYGDAL